MKFILLLLVLLISWLPAAVGAPFYQWLDGQGVTHFTDNPDRIPAKYRARAKKIKLSDEAAPTPGNRPAAEAPAPAPPAATDPNYGGQSEAWWREHFQVLHKELKELQDGLPEKQTRLAELRRKRVIYMRTQDREAVNSVQAEISANELRISELQGQLGELERRATQAGVPSEWRQ